ncbi:multidrug resistance-associated ABC transporter [Rickenella mellea]|uniref:Multidrug resistance-associated ABC transporter n=1 Tax=Rickenella mellea TaxID=50990 RepID=A0A4Y7PY09_9AGAM|nr:multidrug resistance-associated ABC transporter [Rickenella mellea]
MNPFSFWHPPPAPPGFGKDKVLPQEEASLLSKLVFHWLGPFLSVGFTRPLEKDDLWQLPTPRLTRTLTDAIQTNFFARVEPEKRPHFLRNASSSSSSDSAASPTLSPTSSTREERDVEGQIPDTKEGKDPSEGKEGVKGKTVPVEGEKNVKGKKEKKYDASLVKAIHTTFFYRIWTAGIFKLVADTLKTTTPLVNKALLAWLTDAYIFHRLPPGTSPAAAAAQGVTPPRGIGYGIGLGVALFVMQEVASLLTNHYMQITMTTGLSVRTGVVGNIFRKSLRLSGRARLDHTVGQITTMISADASRLDLVSAFVHNIWIAPVQILIGIALLINNLGYSALVGLGVLIIGFPIQFLLVRVMFAQRKKGVKITDRRVRLSTEVLQGIRLIKFFAWESFYTHQIGGLREKEIATIRIMAISRAILISVVTVIPILASVLSFITYALSGHTLTPAIIFSSLQFFNIIRTPLMFFPLVLSAVTDALVALGRIGKFLTAEELADAYKIEQEGKYAVDVEGDFTWETAGKLTEGKFGGVGGGPGGAGMGGFGGGGGGRGGGKGGEGKEKKDKAKKEKKEKKAAKNKKGPILPTNATAEGSSTVDEKTDKSDVEDAAAKGRNKEKGKEDEKPFALVDLQMRVGRGSFVAVVGRVGSGKSSLLQAMIGEMRKVKGEVVFGGSVAYVPQAAWIINATLRENVLFGQDDDDKKFKEVVRACSLQHDIDMLPYGEQTEIGEKGINLSGSSARVSLARAAYADADIVLLDDPLSAVDAHVGKAILENCLLSGPLAFKTRILATHSLNVLPKTDYIFVVDNGVIAEQGTYQNLMRDGHAFAKLIDEYGAPEEDEEDENDKEKDAKVAPDAAEQGEGKAPALMSEEERNRGSVPWSVYRKYLKYAGGVFWAPFIILLLTLMQGASVGNNLFLGYWTARSIPHFAQGEYIAVYASLGVAQAVFSFCASFTFSLVGLYASLRLFKAALGGVLRSPVSFFDTTPMGRIVSRLSKDQDTLDTQLSMTLYQFLSTFSSVIGTVALVFYTFPLLGIIFAPLSILYYGVSTFYRRTSVETKRLDSLMRSALYATYSETLTGLATVRAYGEQQRFIDNAEHGLDLENRAYYMTVSIQRWLSVRLDFFGNILIFGIALFAAGFRTSVNPSKIGVVLSYTLSITQTFSDMVSQFAQNEQNMNAVERVLVYADLPAEGAATTSNDPAPSWPERGGITFKDVMLSYRKGLPLVLKNVSFEVRPGEKVGIVGRTGAGKSSLLQALFRMVEITGGEIEIDGVNIRQIGLDVLRRQLALVPQDSTLFLGTLRENLDPQNARTDAEMISALRRAWLLPRDGAPPDPVADAKFSLDTAVSDEGSNFSAGEKQLLALCRAILKGSRIIVLDEATSSVDFETDSKLQQTIQTEFSDCTLLCIAHRLNTIVYYDRVMVMDSGEVAEFDTPLNLFDKEESIFRSLCDEAGLSRPDILRIQAAVNKAKGIDSETVA